MRSNQRAEIIYRLPVAFTHTASDTTEADVTGMGFAIAANEIWQFEIHMKNGSSAAGGLMWNITVPTGGTILATAFGSISTTTNFRHDEITSSGAVINTYNAANSQAHQTHFWGTVANGSTPGRVQLGVQNNTGVSQTATVAAGSYIIARRIG